MCYMEIDNTNKYRTLVCASQYKVDEPRLLVNNALSGHDHELSGHNKREPNTRQSRGYRFQIQHMVEYAGDQRLEYARHSPNTFREDLINEYIRDHQPNPQHNGHIKHHHKVLYREQPKHPIERVPGEK